jgi:predicted PolB exonuclease-like 3'-5' exonuclease
MNMENKQELYSNMNIKELEQCSITSKEVIDRDTIWQVFYDEENDELYRIRVEKVKERWNKEAEYALDKYNDNMEKYR